MNRNKEEWKLAIQKHDGEKEADLRFLSQAEAEKARNFHKSFPFYEPTPLVNLSKTAKELGLKNIYIKDESCRFGLNAFKALGGSYAVGNYCAEKLGRGVSETTFSDLVSEETRKILGEVTFVTATDGNHGRGVAWIANQIGQKSVVYMPEGSAAERLENIRAEGAQAESLDRNYDDTVRFAKCQAEENGWVLMQDTSWEGYEKIPTWIMQGYGTMGLEAYEQLPEKPTHIFLQAGVGSMAGAVAGLFASIYGNERPFVAVVEPNAADCFYRTVEANDGTCHCVSGSMNTIMAGLACGEPCSIAWDVLADCADFFISFPDYAAANGMRILGNPAKDDQHMVSGESGASAFGCVAEIMTNLELVSLREQMHLDENSVVLFFSTEGATDRAAYREIVWNGKYAKKDF